MTDTLKSDLKAVMDGYTLSEWETEFCDTIMERLKRGVAAHRQADRNGEGDHHEIRDF